MKFKITRLKKCKGCSGCDGMLHYFYKRYHFVACPDSDNNFFYFSGLDVENKKRITLNVYMRTVTEFEKDFENEIKKTVEELRSVREE